MRADRCNVHSELRISDMCAALPASLGTKHRTQYTLKYQRIFYTFHPVLPWQLTTELAVVHAVTLADVDAHSAKAARATAEEYLTA